MNVHEIIVLQKEYQRMLISKKEFIELLRSKLFESTERSEFLFYLIAICEPRVLELESIDDFRKHPLIDPENDAIKDRLVKHLNEYRDKKRVNAQIDPKHFNVLLPDDLLKVRPAISNHGFNRGLYEEILPFVQLAYLEERNGIPEEHAYKLAVMFKDKEAVLKYLSNVQFKEAKHPLHDACLFDLPELLPAWNVTAWQTLASKNDALAKNKKFQKVLRQAGRIEAFIFDKNNIGLELGKISEEIKTKSEKESKTLVAKKLRLEKLQKAIQNLESEQAKNKSTPSEKKIEALKVVLEKEKTEYLSLLSPEELYQVSLNFSYKRASENTDLAYWCQECGLSERDFDILVDLKPQNSDAEIPNVTIMGKAIHPKYGKYYLKKLDKNDPRAGVLGKLSSSCQSIGGAGEACAKYGIESPHSGFYVLCKGDGNNPSVNDPIVAQSWAWKGKEGGIVFDSIEYAKTTQEGFVAGTNNTRSMPDMMIDMYSALAFELTQNHGVPRVLVGTRGQTPQKMGVDLNTGAIKAEEPIDYPVLGYRDSRKQRILSHQNYPLFLLNNVNDIHQPNAWDQYSIEKVKNWIRSNKGTLEALFDTKNETSKVFQAWILACLCSKEEKNVPLISIFQQWLIEEGIDPSQYIKSVDLLKKVKSEYDKGYDSLDITVLEALKKEGAVVELMVGEPLLIYFVKQKNKDKVEKLLKLGFNPNVSDNGGISILGYALNFIDIYILRCLIAHGMEAKDLTFGFSPFNLAMQSGSIEAVQCLLEAGVDPNLVDNTGNPAFYMALSYKGHYKEKFVSLLDLLVSKDANINFINTYDLSVLHAAIAQSDQESLAFFIQKGGDINLSSKTYGSLLLYAAREKKWDIFDWLLKKGAKLSVEDKDEHGNSILSYAVKKGDLRLIELCLQQGFSINFKNKWGESLLVEACRCEPESFEIINFFLEKGLSLDEVDNNGLPVLAHAAQSLSAKGMDALLFRNPKLEFSKDAKTTVLIELSKRTFPENEKLALIKKVIEQGFLGINFKNSEHEAALLYAAQKKEWEIVKYLISKGADVNAIDSQEKTTFFYAAIDSRWNLVEDFLKQDIDFSLKGNKEALLVLLQSKQWTLIELAISKMKSEEIKFLEEHLLTVQAADNKAWDLVELLLQKGANTNQRYHNNSILAQAAVQGRWDLVKAFFLQGASFKEVYPPKFPFNSPLLLAAEQKNWDMVRFFVEHGAEIKEPQKERNMQNMSALLYAAQAQSLETVQYLVEHGEDINEINNKGQSALYFAVEGNNKEMVQYLLGHGIRVELEKLPQSILPEISAMLQSPLVKPLLFGAQKKSVPEEAPAKESKQRNDNS